MSPDKMRSRVIRVLFLPFGTFHGDTRHFCGFEFKEMVDLSSVKGTSWGQTVCCE